MGRISPEPQGRRGMDTPAPIGGKLPVPPDLILGYLIESHLGSGGMGDVYRARQRSLDRTVAVKILSPEFARHRAQIDRFLSEARSAARVTHENLVGAVDAGEAQGRYYFVMEHVKGVPLSQIIRREGPLPERRALEIARQVACGLRHAHRQGLIHRDIKPSNVLLTPEGVAKICDFGLARDLAAEAPSAGGTIQLSPSYASPEQCRGQSGVDHRTDMYSLGVTLFEMLVGRPPFSGDSPKALFSQHLSKPAPAPRSLNPAVSAAASQLVLRLLIKYPQGRFADYDELVAAIDTALAAEPAALPAGPRRRRFPGWVRWAVTGAAVLVVGIVALSFLGGDEPPSPPAPNPPPAVRRERVEQDLDEARRLQREAEGRPERYPEVLERWKDLEEKYRGTPHQDLVSEPLQEFEQRLVGEADAAAERLLREADRHLWTGRSAEALHALQGFSPGFEGTEACSRVARKTAEIERNLDDQYRAGKDRFFGLLAARRHDEARAQIARLAALVSVVGPGGTHVVRPALREEIGRLTKRLDDEALAARAFAPGTGPKPPPPPPEPKTTPPKPVDPPKAAAPEHVAILRDPARRSDAERRVAAAAAFSAGAPKSALCRAAQQFLSRDERGWELVVDRLTLRTGQGEAEWEGQATAAEGGVTVFRAVNGQRAAIQPDGRVSVNGGAFARPERCELVRGLRTPAAAALEEYLAAAPFDRPESIRPMQHYDYILLLGRKMEDCGDAPAQALQLFACAHADEILTAGGDLEPAAASRARLMRWKSTPLWGPPAAVERIVLARLLLAPPPGVELKEAAQAGAGSPDHGVRVLSALALFAEPAFDPSAALALWRRLAALAPEPAVAKFCEATAARVKEVLACGACGGTGRTVCKACAGKGAATCETCRGLGKVYVSGFTMCRPCAGRGAVACPACSGAPLLKCAACEGKKQSRSAPAEAFRPILQSYLCPGCAGSGSVFGRVAYPCPRCDGLGRLPKN